MEFLSFIIFIVVFLLSVILHEIAHGFVANHFGDDTARVAGRLSLNPLVHIDPIGSIAVPFLLYLSQSGFLFGWAKPVPVNPYRLRGGAMSYRLVSLAGIFTNFGLAVAATVVLKVASLALPQIANNLGVIFFSSLLQINLVLAVFNLMPFPGFDGFNFLTTFRPVAELVAKTPLGNQLFMLQYGLMISMLLVIVLMPFIYAAYGFVFSIFAWIFGLS